MTENDSCKSSLFEKLQLQVQPEADEPEDDADEEKQTDKSQIDENNNSQEIQLLYISPQEEYRRELEALEAEANQDEDKEKEKVFHPDEVFKSAEDQMQRLKVKVVVEYFCELKKQHTQITPKLLSEWMLEFADKYMSIFKNNLLLPDINLNFKLKSL